MLETRAQAVSVPKTRTPGLPLDERMPRYWFANNVFATHVANGVNLLFPAGERFFVRSVHHYLDRVKDPHLRAQVKGFFGQEGRHAKEHERQFALLRAEGFPVDQLLAWYERVAFEGIEKVAPAELALATTAACEHFTAIMAENVLRRDMLQHAHPTMRALLLWHASEEIEHRSVAFDVLAEVNPSYALRVAGLIMATTLLGTFWALATSALLVTDPEVDFARLVRDFRAARQARLKRNPEAKGTVQDVFLRGIREYLRRDFHPSQSDIDTLAETYLAGAGLA